MQFGLSLDEKLTKRPVEYWIIKTQYTVLIPKENG